MRRIDFFQKYSISLQAHKASLTRTLLPALLLLFTTAGCQTTHSRLRTPKKPTAAPNNPQQKNPQTLPELKTFRVDCHLIEQQIKLLSRKPLTAKNLQMLKRQSGLTVSLIRNGLFAKLGYRFRTLLYAYFFSQLSWYKALETPIPGSRVLKNNAQTLRNFERTSSFYSEKVRDKMRALCKTRLLPQGKTTLAKTSQSIPEQLVKKSRRYVGTSYCLGGRHPSRGCFDCSGFVRYLFLQYGYRLPHSARRQFRYGRWVSRRKLQKGDLLFFSKKRSRYSISHVGIYVGNALFIHAENRKRGVRLTSIHHSWYKKHYVGARRILSSLQKPNS